MSRLKGTTVRKMLRWGASLGVTAVCLYYVISRIELHEVVRILSQADVQLIIVALGLYFGVFLILVRMWQVLLDTFDIRCDFWQLLILYFISFSAGFFLPSTVGSFVPVLYLHKKGYPLVRLTFVTSLNIVFQIIPPIAFSLVAVFTLPPLSIFRPTVILIILVMVGLGGILALLYFFRQDVAARLKSLLDKLLFKWGKRFKSIDAETGQSYIGLHRLVDWRVIWAVFLAFAATTVGCTAFYLLALSVGTRLSLWEIAVCLSIMTIVTMLPVSVGGIGLREGSLVFLFTLLGETSEKAVVLSLLLFINITFWRLVGLPLWLRFSSPLGRQSLQ